MAREQFHFVHSLRVRWSEVDVQRVVFFGNHLNFFDVAMTEYMRATNFRYPARLQEHGTDLHVVRAAVDYKGEVRFDDELDIAVRVARVGRSSLTFAFETFRKGENEILITGELIYVNVGIESRKSAPLPDELREEIRKREGDLPFSG